MNSYHKKFARYYDEIYGSRDYQQDANFILAHSKETSSLLDIGCGTLSHSLLLSFYFNHVTAVDISPEMIAVARDKLRTVSCKNVVVLEGDIEVVNSQPPFNTVISMFNLINHIKTREQLSNFFMQVHKLLGPGGVFIFDCWNGAASRRDVPSKNSLRRIEARNFDYVVQTDAITDLMKGETSMDILIKVEKDSELVEQFNVFLTHRLWTPDLIEEELMRSGFVSIKCLNRYSLESESFATIENHRLAYVCERGEL